MLLDAETAFAVLEWNGVIELLVVPCRWETATGTAARQILACANVNCLTICNSKGFYSVLVWLRYVHPFAWRLCRQSALFV